MAQDVPQNCGLAQARVILKTTKSANKLPHIKRRRRSVSLEHQLKQKSTAPEKETSSLWFNYTKRVKLVSLEEHIRASKTQEEPRRGCRFCVPATVRVKQAKNTESTQGKGSSPKLDLHRHPPDPFSSCWPTKLQTKT